MEFKLTNTSGGISETINLETLEEMLEFMMAQDEVEFVIIKPGEGSRPGFHRSYWELEVYDDYRES